MFDECCIRMLIYCCAAELFDQGTNECLSTDDGRQYVGTASRTMSGRSCQHWNSQSPHEHVFTEIDFFPDRNSGATIADVSNYCRNPLAGSLYKPLPWCYTDSRDMTWEFCNIPRCRGTQ